MKARVGKFMFLHTTGAGVKCIRDVIKGVAHQIRAGSYTDNEFYNLAVARCLQARQWMLTVDAPDDVKQRVYANYLAWNRRLIKEFPLLVCYNELDTMDGDKSTVEEAIRALPTPQQVNSSDAAPAGMPHDDDKASELPHDDHLLYAHVKACLLAPALCAYPF